jgi:TPR repeat protein
LLYQNGWGVARDYAEALTWYQKAADQGYAKAQNNIGWLYEQGLGVAQDLAKAREWYKKSADGGNAKAKAALNRLSDR